MLSEMPAPRHPNFAIGDYIKVDLGSVIFFGYVTKVQPDGTALIEPMEMIVDENGKPKDPPVFSLAERL